MNLVPECSVKSASADLENLSAFRHPAAALHRGCFTQAWQKSGKPVPAASAVAFAMHWRRYSLRRS